MATITSKIEVNRIDYEPIFEVGTHLVDEIGTNWKYIEIRLGEIVTNTDTGEKYPLVQYRWVPWSFTSCPMYYTTNPVEGYVPRIIATLTWIIANMKYQHDDTGIEGNYSPELKEAIELLEILKGA